MSTGKMHIDEVNVDVSLVSRLLAAQFPHWTNLPIEPVHSAGTDNSNVRLGDEMSVRLPRILNATGQVEKEHQWLPKLAPHLPRAIAVPLAIGIPVVGWSHNSMLSLDMSYHLFSVKVSGSHTWQDVNILVISMHGEHFRA